MSKVVRLQEVINRLYTEVGRYNPSDVTEELIWNAAEELSRDFRGRPLTGHALNEAVDIVKMKYGL